MILCVDFADKKTKITGVERERKRVRVVTSHELADPDPDRSLRDYLKSISASVDEIRVSAALEDTFHKVFLMPDLKKKMLRSALETEVVKAFGGDYQFKDRDIGEAPGPGGKANRKIMTAGLKRDALEKLSLRFADSRIKPSVYTTYPAAVQCLLEETGILSEEPLAFVEIDRPSSRIIVFKGAEIRLTREVNVAEEGKDPDHSMLAKDIYRTLLFYNEAYPEDRVSRLVFAGNSAVSDVAPSLRQKAAAEIVAFDPKSTFSGLDKTTYVHAGCLGLALLDPVRCGFGFVPFSVQEKKKVKRTLAVSSSVSLGVLLVFVLLISRFSLELINLNAFHRGIKGEIKMKEDRLREMSLEFVSQSIESSQPPWSDILMELAAVVPPGVALNTLTLRQVKRVWRGEVTGVAEGADEIASLLKVEETQSSFERSPLFSGVRLTERELRGSDVEFKITYQLEI
jgi:hypothetical protein